MPELIRVQGPDGWETLGIDRTPGIFPEGISPTWSAWGPDSLTFTIKRDPTLSHRDLAAFTPIEYLPDGERVAWGGYLIDSPASSGDDPQLSVSAQGWQYHLDDDPFRQVYVSHDMSGFRDQRTFPNANLSLLPASATVDVSGGRINMGFAKGSNIPTNRYLCITLDLGAGVSGPRNIAVDYEQNPNLPATIWSFVVRSSASPDMFDGANYNDPIIRYFASEPASGIWTGTCSDLRRYVHMFIGTDPNQVSGTAGLDYLLSITGVRFFGDGGILGDGPYHDGNGQSALKAHQVIHSARSRATALNWTNERVQEPAFVLPSFGNPTEERTAREYMEAANSYLGWKLQVDALRRIVFEPQPSRPILSVNTASAGVQFGDASVNSGRDVYNKVVVRGRSGGGDDLEVVCMGPGNTELDRRGRIRSKVLTIPAPTTVEAMTALGNVYVARLAKIPLRGTLAIEGNAVRLIKSDTGVDPADLGAYVGELILLADLVDPVTGELGRVGTIAGVSTQAADGARSATVAIDNSRDSFEALLNRMTIT